MIPRVDINGACRGKSAYLSFEKAHKAMARGRFKDNDVALRGKMKPYRCRLCHSWHIGRSNSTGSSR